MALDPTECKELLEMDSGFNFKLDSGGRGGGMLELGNVNIPLAVDSKTSHVLQYLILTN